MKKPMKKFKRYQDGGDVAADKQRGLDISNKEEPVGFFERIRMGNIDEPGSEAYNRFGAGRGRAAPAAAPAPTRTIAPAAPAMPAASSTPLSDDMYSDFGPSEGRSSSETIKPTRQVMNKPTLPAKPAATPVPSLSNAGPMRGMRSDASSPQYAGPMRGMRSDAGASKPAASAASQIPGQSAKAPQGEKIDSSETSRNIENALLATGAGGVGLAGLYKMFKGGKKAASKASPYLKELTMDKKKLTGPSTTSKSTDVTDAVPKKTSYRSETDPTKREDAKANEAYERLKKLTRKKDDGMKRGGAVKKYASGGMVSSASRRADGIATKGKTRGKIC